MGTMRIQTTLLSLFFLILAAPLLIWIAHTLAPTDSRLSRLAVAELSGVTVPQSAPTLTFRSWQKGRYQEQAAAYFGQTFPLREPLIRLSNEIDYRFLKQSSAPDNPMIVGQQSQLYQYGYAAEYCGIRPTVPLARLDEIVRDMGELHTRLQKRGIPFVVLLTPHKASIYPEYLPYTFLRHRAAHPPHRSYDDVLPLLKKYGVPYVDGYPILIREKTKNTLPLFVPGGAHWNELGAYFTTQALLAELNRQKETPLPELEITKRVDDRLPVGEDADLARLLNVIVTPTNYPVPHLTFRGVGAPPAKKLVVVGGSFDWKILHSLNDAKIYNAIDFYFYYSFFKFHFPEKVRTEFDKKALNWEKDFLDSDAIVLEINEEAFGKTGRDTHYDTFVTDALQHIR